MNAVLCSGKKILPLLVCLGFFTDQISLANASEGAKLIPVPYVSQIPTGAWVLPWSQACEEASAAMVEGFYARKKSIPVSESVARMKEIFDWEKDHFPSIEDTDAVQTKRFIDELPLAFKTTIKRNPTLKEIQRELDKDQPVIALVNMYTLYQASIKRDSYHVLVITGYDDKKKQFIFQDPARSYEKTHSYDITMSALHDYNAKSKEGDGVPTVLFTTPPPPTKESFIKRLIDLLKNLF
ncbi:C39 family peptidase [Patescibacteria group bacterium]|nr:C39 family peptidase [Patescibacteria group bacterium]